MPAARRFALWSLHYWGLGAWRRADDVPLCVGELATNALVHGVPPGRGLPLLGSALGDTWGVGERSPGKAVWAESGR